MTSSSDSSSSSYTITSTIPLPSSPNVNMPRLGFGLYQSPPSITLASCLHALKSGYRHIDSAQYYANETEMGASVRQYGLKRSEVFLTTKTLAPGGSPEKTYQKCLESVERVDPRKEGEGKGYVDLFLIHSPSSGKEGIKEIWQALERLKEEGRVRSLGVSNFGVGYIEGMREYAKVWPPEVNQIELHPFCQQRSLVTYCQRHNIIVQAYCPLVRNYKATNPTLLSMSQKVGKTTGQVLCRWSLQRGFVPLPKSDNPGRIEENAGLFGWELGEEEMRMLDGLDEGEEGAIVQVGAEP